MDLERQGDMAVERSFPFRYQGPPPGPWSYRCDECYGHET